LNTGVAQPPSGPPVWVELRGNSHADAESVLAYELGYRLQPVRSLSLDVATFYNVYHSQLIYVSDAAVFEVSPAPPHILASSTVQNLDRVNTYGIEISAQWQVLPDWRLLGSYTGLRVHSQLDPTVKDASPASQGQLRSYLDLPRHFEINAAASYIDTVTVTPAQTPVRIPAYVRLDLGVGCHLTEALEVGLWGQNLLHSRHPEFPSVQTALQVEIPRSVLARVDWRF
jgi:iron complex outermembrane receptor protein